MLPILSTYMGVAVVEDWSWSHFITIEDEWMVRSDKTWMRDSSQWTYLDN